jgi:DNA gyrase subunit B
MQVLERRGYSRDVVERMLARDVREKSFFADRGNIEAFAEAIARPAMSAAIRADEEHNLFELQIEDRSTGYPRRYTLTADFLTSAEYRQLLGGYPDVKAFLTGPFVVATSGVTESPEDSDETEPAAEPRPRRAREEQVSLSSVDELVEYFITAGKKGIAINRYKGLGEMNPEQLWDTTMNPEARTLLQVRAEDHAEADLMFTTLMGDQVEPRRKFIEDNALDVKNLDV